MTNLLRKLFIKNYKDVTNPKIREKHGLLAAFVGIFTNLVLFVVKLLIGIFAVSITIITDAINNLTDFGSCIVNVIGFKLANKPADKEHPYGHERIEYIAGMIISFIIICIAVVLGYQSVIKIINNEQSTPEVLTLIILGIAILAKLWQGFFYKKMSKAINSVTLKASSQDSFNDVIATSIVLLVSLTQFILVKNNVTVPVSIDGIAGVALAIFIVISGIKLVIETSNPLIGLTPDNERVKPIIEDILKYEGVLGVHDTMCHSYGPTKLFMTIHVEVDDQVNVNVSHDLMDIIEKEVGQKHNVLLTVHMDPIDNTSQDVKELKAKAVEILSSYNEILKLHDFRMVKGTTHTNVLFDVVIPFESKIKESELDSYLKDEFNKLDSKYNLVIHYDNDYLN